MEDTPKAQINKGGMPRRTFIDLAKNVVLTLATSGAIELTKSPEIELTPTVATIDFFNLKDTLDPQNPAWKDMGVSDPTVVEEVQKASPKTRLHYELLLRTLFALTYPEHGEEVVSIQKNTAKKLGANSSLSINQISINHALALGKIDYDSLGNPILHATLSAVELNRAIQNTPESIINLSLEPGVIKVQGNLFGSTPKYPDLQDSHFSVATPTDGSEPRYYYNSEQITKEKYDELQRQKREKIPLALDPEHRSYEFQDGYTGDNTLGNLKSLVEIALRNPTKLIIAAGGNPTRTINPYTNEYEHHIPDITNARKILEARGLWPKNLIMVGFAYQLQSGVFVPASRGLDIYVPANSSSFATPVVTEANRDLVFKGFKTVTQIKQQLFSLTTPNKYFEGAQEKDFRLLHQASGR